VLSYKLYNPALYLANPAHHPDILEIFSLQDFFRIKIELERRMVFSSGLVFSFWLLKEG